MSTIRSAATPDLGVAIIARISIAYSTIVLLAATAKPLQAVPSRARRVRAWLLRCPPPYSPPCAWGVTQELREWPLQVSLPRLTIAPLTREFSATRAND